MKLEMNKKNMLLITIGVVVLFVIILLIILINKNGKVTGALNTSKKIAEDVFYDEGSSSFTGKFEPTDSYCKGIYKRISFNKKTDGDDLKARVSMKIKNIDADILKSPDVYWVVTAGDESSCTGDLSQSMNYGTFIGRNNGEELILLQDVSVTTEEQIFSLWIWIDKKGKDVKSLVDKNVDIDIVTNIDKLDKDK